MDNVLSFVQCAFLFTTLGVATDKLYFFMLFPCFLNCSLPSLEFFVKSVILDNFATQKTNKFEVSIVF